MQPNLYQYVLAHRINENRANDLAMAEAMQNSLREARLDQSQQRLDLERRQQFAREQGAAAKTAGQPVPEFADESVNEYAQAGGMEADAAFAKMYTEMQNKDRLRQAEQFREFGDLSPEVKEFAGFTPDMVPTKPEAQAAADIWESHRRKQRGLAPKGASNPAFGNLYPSLNEAMDAYKLLVSDPSGVRFRNAAQKGAAVELANLMAMAANMVHSGGRSEQEVNLWLQSKAGKLLPTLKQGPYGTPEPGETSGATEGKREGESTADYLKRINQGQ